MRKALIPMLVLIFTASTLGQSDNAHQRESATIHRGDDDGGGHLGIYVSPALKFGKIANETRTMAGLRVGLEFGPSFYAGLAGYAVPEKGITNHSLIHRYYDHNDWSLSYGGVEAGFISGSQDAVQLAVGVLAARGSVREAQNNFDDYRSFWTLEPQGTLMFNISRGLRLNAGVGYRFINDLKSTRYTKKDLEGVTGNIGIAVGSF